MKRRLLTSIAATPVFLATALARAQAPAVPADAPPAAAPPTAAATAPEAPPPTPKPAAPPVVTAGAVNKFAVQVYGLAELDTWYDNIQNAGEGVGNSIIASKGTQAGDNGRWVWTARNSRFGFRVNAPEWEGTKASANVEADFGGGPAGSAPPALGGAAAPPTPYSNSYGNEAGYTTTGVVRLRHAYLKLETPYFDILAGQTWDLFGWNNLRILGNGSEYQGITGQIYHRNPEIRLTHKVKTDVINVELAVAAVRPFQRDSQIPDFQGGVRLEIPGWSGVHVIGAGKPTVDGAAIGISGMYRSFKLLQHPALGPMDMAPKELGYDKKNGFGGSFDAFFPIYGATFDDQSNAFALTGEVSYTKGLADMFGALNGGLPNAPALRSAVAAMPMAMPPVAAVAAIPYSQNFDNGVLTWSGTELVPVKWLNFTANLQYHLPVYNGKLLWIAGDAGYVKLLDTASYNLGMTALPGVMKQSLWIDASLFVSLGPAAQIVLNYATYQNTFMDDSKSARLNRIMYAMYFWF